MIPSPVINSGLILGPNSIMFEYFGSRLYCVRVNPNGDAKPSKVNVILRPGVNSRLILGLLCSSRL